MPLLYGDLKVRELWDCFKTRYPSVNQGLRGSQQNSDMPPREGLLKVKQAVETMLVSTAVTDTVVPPLRTQLKSANVSCLMFIRIVGLSLESWNQTKLVRKWVMTRRSADHVSCRERPALSPYLEAHELKGNDCIANI